MKRYNKKITNQEKSGIAILSSEKIDLKPKHVWDKEGYYIMGAIILGDVII